jgi:hypothetical protein
MSFVTKNVNSQTEKLIYGNWIFKSKEEEICIEISKEKTTLIKKKNDEKNVVETFDSNCHWFNEQLLFIDGGQKYYAKFANDEKMVFGEVEAPILNRIVWEEDFLRIKN